MKLFEKANLGNLELKNRIIMAPMGTGLGGKDGIVSKRVIDHYARIAQGGTGLIIVEATEVDPVQVVVSDMLRICADKYIPGLTALVREVHARGAKISVQLHHPGRQARSAVTGQQPVAPSPIAGMTMGYRIGEVPRELSTSEIGSVIKQFVDAAKRAKAAGFDAIDLHGAHGYLIAQFLSPHSNKRNDLYGGDTRRRARFALEIIEGIRKEVGKDFPITFKISVDEHLEGGITLPESKVIIKLLEKAGINAICVSTGTYETFEWSIQPMLFPVGCLVPLAEEIKKTVDIPVIAVGRINSPSLAEQILREGKADFIAMGRALLADPDLPVKALEGRVVRRCLACSTCMEEVPIVCAQNPELGKVGETEAKADKVKKVLVVGGEPVGLEAARISRLRGHEVTLWDRNPNLGGRWSWLIEPYIKNKLEMIDALGVKIELGKKITPEAIARFSPDAVIVTAEKEPVIPQIPGIKQANIFLADDVIEGRAKVEGKALIIGGESMACEAALLLSRRGLDTTIVAESSSIGRGLNFIVKKVMTDKLAELGAHVLTNIQVAAIEGNDVTLKQKDGSSKVVKADNVVIALGSKPRADLQESLKGSPFEVYPVRLCEQPRDVYRSSQEGASVARKV